MYLRFKAHGYIIKKIGIIQPESRYLISGIAVSIKSDLRYCASGMAVQNCPEYSWMDYEITRQELEEADELCHGNWIELEKKNEYIRTLQSILDCNQISYPKEI